MKKQILLLFLVWFNFIQIFCFQIFVGNGTEIWQHLPCDPFYDHSGSQMIYDSDYFPYSGTITEISFQYYINTPNPESYIGNAILMLGESSLDSYQDEESYIDLNELEICFEGDFTADNFQAVNSSGDGWFTVTLDQPYFYSGTGNLILFFLENNSNHGMNGDDFISFDTSQNTSMCFIDLDNPIDLDNLVEPIFIRNKLPNSIFEFTISEYYPQVVAPLNNAEDIDCSSPLVISVRDLDNTEIIVYSPTNYFNLDIEDNFQHLSGNNYEIYPLLAFAPNSYYEWEITYTYDNTEYESELFGFTTDDVEDSLELINQEVNAHSVELTWNSLYGNQYPYSIIRNDEIISRQFGNSFIDTQVSVNDSYDYKIKFLYIDDSFVESNLCSVVIPGDQSVIIDEGFENYSSFQTNIGNWQNIDQDQNATYSLPGCNYPNEGDASGFIIFEPADVVPPLELDINGEKCLVSFASSQPPTSDLLISPSFQTSQVEIDIYLKSYATSWGMERVKCGLIYNNDDDNLVYFNDGNYYEIGEEMTHLSFVQQTSNSQDFISNFWLESCGVQTLMLIIDRIIISSSETSNNNSEQALLEPQIFPNPVRHGSFELVNQRGNSEVIIYNLKGQLVHKLKTNSKTQRIILPKNLASGIYLVKVKSSQGEFVRKISLLK